MSLASARLSPCSWYVTIHPTVAALIKFCLLVYHYAWESHLLGVVCCDLQTYCFLCSLSLHGWNWEVYANSLLVMYVCSSRSLSNTHCLVVSTPRKTFKLVDQSGRVIKGTGLFSIWSPAAPRAERLLDSIWQVFSGPFASLALITDMYRMTWKPKPKCAQYHCYCTWDPPQISCTL
jgi:hypothetical protein